VTREETNDLLIRDSLISELTKQQTVSASLPLLQRLGQLEAACIHMVYSTIVHSNRNCVELGIHKIKQPSSAFFQPQTIPVWDSSNGISADHEALLPRGMTLICIKTSLSHRVASALSLASGNDPQRGTDTPCSTNKPFTEPSQQDARCLS
jgi:hypothetical protein